MRLKERPGSPRPGTSTVGRRPAPGRLRERGPYAEWDAMTPIDDLSGPLHHKSAVEVNGGLFPPVGDEACTPSGRPFTCDGGALSQGGAHGANGLLWTAASLPGAKRAMPCLTKRRQRSVRRPVNKDMTSRRRARAFGGVRAWVPTEALGAVAVHPHLLFWSLLCAFDGVLGCKAPRVKSGICFLYVDTQLARSCGCHYGRSTSVLYGPID